MGHVVSAKNRPYVQIEITTRCNYQCFYCAGRDMPQAHMSWETFTEILRNEIEHTPSRISLQGEGEPMMHPRFWDMVEAIREAGLIPYTITNGSLMDAARIARTFKNIGISLDTIDPVFAQRIGRYKLPRVLANIDALRTVMSPDKIFIHTVDMGQPLDPLRKYLKERGLMRHVVQPLQTKTDYSRRYAAPNEQLLGRCTFNCRFVNSVEMRYYDISGRELPCCFIKDVQKFSSREHVREQLDKRIVPDCCTGCRMIFPNARIGVVKPTARRTRLASAVEISKNEQGAL